MFVRNYKHITRTWSECEAGYTHDEYAQLAITGGMDVNY